MRTHTPFLIAATLAALAPNVALARPAPPRAAIAFANHGGVENWQAEGDSTIYFEDTHGRWFRARLMSPAFDLPYVEAIGIDSRPSGTLDRFGGVIVRGRSYPFTSFEAIAGPPEGKRHPGRLMPRHKPNA